MRENTDQSNSEYGYFLRSEDESEEYEDWYGSLVLPMKHFATVWTMRCVAGGIFKLTIKIISATGSTYFL